MKELISGPYFLEANISEVDNDIFKVEKQNIPTSYSENENSDVTFGYTDISMFTYKQGIPRKNMNVSIHGKAMLGECQDCGNLSNGLFSDVTWGDVLVLGLGGFGVLPEYIKENKNPSSIDVVEKHQEIVDYVTWLNSPINIVCNDEWNYSTTKQYDVIICDLFSEAEDVLESHKTTLLNNYANNLKTNGLLVIPRTGEKLENQ